MPGLVTTNQVMALLDDQLTDPSRDLSPFILTADLIINEDLANAGLSKARLTQIELYLAAHFAVVAIEHGGLTRQRMGDADEFYNVNSSVGLRGTRFGQQALVFDTSGTLQELDSMAQGGRAEFTVVQGRTAGTRNYWLNRALKIGFEGYIETSFPDTY